MGNFSGDLRKQSHVYEILMQKSSHYNVVEFRAQVLQHLAQAHKSHVRKSLVLREHIARLDCDFIQREFHASASSIEIFIIL